MLLLLVGAHKEQENLPGTATGLAVRWCGDILIFYYEGECQLGPTSLISYFRIMSSLTTTAASLDAKALKKREQNRKKKARQRAKKQQLKEQEKSSSSSSTDAIVHKSTRKQAGTGRGQGLFATCNLLPGDIISRTRPALSTVFDPYAGSICAYCFKPASQAGTVPVEIALRKQDGRVGVYLVEKELRGALRVVVNGCADDSVNALSGVMAGDVVESIDGVPMTTESGALDRCLKLLKSAGEANDNCLFPLGVRRVALQPCLTCSRAAICIDCDKAGFGAWHSSYECQAFKNLPGAVTKGESSPIRMMLRYKAIAAKGEWTATTADSPPGTKEPLALVHTLQANTDVVPPQQRAALSKITGVPEKVVSLLIGQIRGNAASIERGGNKVGCALSAHMGYSNHDCTPNAEAIVDGAGFVVLRALAKIDAHSEICISYIDVNQHVSARLSILASHYEFKCTCTRCLTEKRAWLKAKAKNRGEEYLMNNSVLARNAYVHDSSERKSNSSAMSR